MERDVLLSSGCSEIIRGALAASLPSSRPAHALVSHAISTRPQNAFACSPTNTMRFFARSVDISRQQKNNVDRVIAKRRPWRSNYHTRRSF